jgi:diguanylate cyclase (GGDEF)-like protein
VVFEPFRSYQLTVRESPVYLEVRQFDDLLYIEIEPDLGKAEDESLPAVTQGIVSKLRAADSLPRLLNLAASELKKLTGYDRVMVYQFQEDGHGVVVAEEVHREMWPYLGLHYPASDIPNQARQLYMIQRIRVVSDSTDPGIPILGAAQLQIANKSPRPLDLTYCHLRSVSPIHLEYLRNLGVRATLTLSLIVDDRLWGMLVCHHRTVKLPSPSIRSSCDLISQLISFLIGARIELDLSEETKLAAWRVEKIATLLDHQGEICDALVKAGSHLLPLVGASGALISFEGKSELVGVTPSLKDSMQILSRLHPLSGGKVFSHGSIEALLPEFSRLKSDCSGILLMPMLGSPENAILWFRPEVVETVRWGGNPDKAAEIDPATGRTSPRKSFEAWKVKMDGRSAPWTPADLKAAGELRRAISDHLLAKAEGTISNLDVVDSLTLLPNRRRFQTELRLRAESSEGGDVSVILINIDRFKQVNEAFGHTVGDQLLLQVTRRLASIVNSNVLLARLGGDEFAVMCSGNAASRADEIAEEITNVLAAPFELGGKPFRITASLGIAHAGIGEKELLRAADTAMHFAKRNGRNRLASFNKLLHEAAVKSLEIQQDMYRAIEAQEFKIVYQPIVALRDRRLLGFEALLRWHHPSKGMIPPLDFIPLAEDTGLIVPIGKGVLREAVRKIRTWIERYGCPLKVHVNVASPQLVGGEFVRDVRAVLEEFALEPRSLSIEVTESVLMRDSAFDSLTTLKEMGLEVSIDDFGTGYSSLAYLQKLPVDIIKVDKTFIDDIVENEKSKQFLEAMLLLTKTLGLRSIAEGVETEAQRDALLELGCSQAQGYYFSRPLDVAAAERLIAACQSSDGRIPRQ